MPDLLPWHSIYEQKDFESPIYDLIFYKKDKIRDKIENNENNENYNFTPLNENEKFELNFDKETKKEILIQNPSKLIFCLIKEFSFEEIRNKSSNLIKDLKNEKIKKIRIQKINFINFDVEESISDGIILGQFNYDFLKQKKSENQIIFVNKDSLKSKSQNLARFLSLTPSNLMTPFLFTEYVKDVLNYLELPVVVEIFDEERIKDLKMNLFLSVGNGSSEKSQLVILSYLGREIFKESSFESGDKKENKFENKNKFKKDFENENKIKKDFESKNENEKKKDFEKEFSFDKNNKCIDENEYDLIIVGKGITFDSGGLSLKPPKSQIDMKGDMMGGAIAFSSILGIIQEKRKINLKVIIPLAENMPGNNATKPGDVIFSRKGKSVLIDNTDAEGRLILADALNLAEEFKSNMIISIATLTGACCVALGNFFYGIFTNSEECYEKIKKSGEKTADFGWRLPLCKKYTKLLESDIADLNNISFSGGGSSIAASFLKEFVEKNEYVHLDIAPMIECENVKLYGKRMSGRPCAMLYWLMRDLCGDMK